jgi:uncharacterized protein YutE (UPF0331/DUF86 family)
MIARKSVKEKIQILEQNIINLQEFKSKISFEDLEKRKFDEWALRYGFIESIQIIIDISCHLVSYYNLGKPVNYSECIDYLQKHDYISKELKEKLKGMIEFRNNLLYEPTSIDLGYLYGQLENINNMRQFIEKVDSLIKE